MTHDDGIAGAGILIVEDGDHMRARLRAFLASAFPEHAIHETATAAEACESVRNHRPQVVLMDITLPDGNGIELTATLTTTFPGLRIIMVTQFVDGIYVEHALAAGAFGYVAKEHIHRNLLPLVASALGMARDGDDRKDLHPDAAAC